MLGFGTSWLMPMPEDSAREVAARPPRWSFSVVWVCLYLLLGIAWSRELNSPWPVHVCIVALLALFMLWQVLFSKTVRKPKEATYVLVAAIAIVLMVRDVGKDAFTSLLLAPLVAWLIFASILSVQNLQLRQQRKL